MTPEQAAAAYARSLTDRVTVTRPSTSATATGCRARVTGYQPSDLVGGIIQGDRSMVIFAADLAAAGFPQPLAKGDRVTFDGATLAVVAGHDARRVDGVTIAWNVQLRGF